MKVLIFALCALLVFAVPFAYANGVVTTGAFSVASDGSAPSETPVMDDALQDHNVTVKNGGFGQVDVLIGTVIYTNPETGAVTMSWKLKKTLWGNGLNNSWAGGLKKGESLKLRIHTPNPGGNYEKASGEYTTQPITGD